MEQNKDCCEMKSISKTYHKSSSCTIVYWIAKIYQWITVKQGWLIEKQRHS